MMNVCKEFMQHIRKVSYKKVFLILDSDVLPQLTDYVILINDIKFEDGCYHQYYGEVKKLISSFMTFWKLVIDDVIQEADRCENAINREELLVLIDRTIDIHQGRQIAFGKGFLPVRSPLEKQVYDEMGELYDEYMEKLYDRKAKIEKLDKREKVDGFAKAHFKITVASTAELFETTHIFLAIMLADRIKQIGISIEEVLLRLVNNLRTVKGESKQAFHGLVGKLYDKNKEMLQISRQYRRSSIEQAEARHSIDSIRSKIETFSYYDPSLSRLEEEVEYWEKRLKEFKEVADPLFELKKERDDVCKQEEIWKSMRSSELPGSKRQCWLNMGNNFAERKQYLKEKMIELAKMLVTFFTVSGNDRVMYSDEVGSYFMDEFKHQVYVLNYGMGVYHKTCEGEFKEVKDNIPYYFDAFGRYIIDDKGEKIYQCAPCSSQYKLTTVDLLRKTTVDCGHSEKLKQKCQMGCKDLNLPGEVVPDIPLMDIRSTLEPEVVRYLWDSFGHVLPQALHDVGRDRTRNPLQYLAHKILFHKYNKTKAEVEEKMKESQEYRINFFKERKEKAMRASRAWKAKQVKRRKPEESDARDECTVREALAAEAAIVDTMNLL